MNVRKRLTIVAILSTALLLAAAGSYYGVGRYHRNFKGMTEAQAVDILGKPTVDSRTFEPLESDYTLGWYFLVGSQLGLRLIDGVVVDQTYGSK